MSEQPNVREDLRRKWNRIEATLHSERAAPIEAARRLRELAPELWGSEVAQLLSEEPIWDVPKVPELLAGSVAPILSQTNARVVLDPWAGFGGVVGAVMRMTHAERGFAVVPDSGVHAAGAFLVPEADWVTGFPWRVPELEGSTFDVVASVLPVGARLNQEEVPIELRPTFPVSGPYDLGQVLLAWAVSKLSSEGVGVFVVPDGLFFQEQSIWHRLQDVGVGVDAVFSMPPDRHTNVHLRLARSLIVVRPHLVERLFVAQLTTDAETNRAVIANYHSRRDAALLESGRWVQHRDFRGLDSLRLLDRIRNAETSSGHPSRALGEVCSKEVCSKIELARTGAEFPKSDDFGQLFIPLLGTGDVQQSRDTLSMKPQNYARLTVDSNASDVRFVAHFLNSELGRDIRGLSMTGTIPRLTLRTLQSLPVVIPDLATQQEVLEAATAITEVEIPIRAMITQLAELRLELWRDLGVSEEAREKLNSLSSSFTQAAKQRTEQDLDAWVESLPFPLASILRAWRATGRDDHKGKDEHLRHFFEACAEFFGLILLSGFVSDGEWYEEAHRATLLRALGTQNLSLRRSTFGAWKVVVEFLGKQTREMLEGDADRRAACALRFSDPTLRLPRLVSDKRIMQILTTANQHRNQIVHGGVMNQLAARGFADASTQSLAELRDAMADGWVSLELLRPLNTRRRLGTFENEVEVLRGSNPRFLREVHLMSDALDVDLLYLRSEGNPRALQLLPLIQMGPVPEGERQACYFYNRIDGERVKFVSYHFGDASELTDASERTVETLKLLSDAERFN